MSILSFNFIVFLAAALLVYYLAPRKYQWIALLVISYAFYLLASLRTAIFILITTATTFFAGRWIGKINDEFAVEVANYKGPNPKITREEKKAIQAKEDKRKRVIVVLTLVLNFGILIGLKYINPIVDVMNGFCRLVGLRYEIPTLSILVPLGISYYTFQAMGYIIDLYRRKYQPEKNIAHFALFVSFFPQLIQGPISRYNEFNGQLFEPHRFSATNLRHGAELAVWGLFKKLVISDRLAIVTTMVFGNPETYGGYYLLIGTIMSIIRIYTDFSGGIDITRGVAEMFGIVMPENFTQPFFARNFSDFWRRWHITMNQWWRDYIFYPLTLSRPLQKFGKSMRKVVGDNFSKKLPILIAVIICRIINAIWHGASMHSILSGAYYGLVLALSFYFEPHIVKLTKKLKIRTECLSWKIFQCVRTFVVFGFPYLFTGAKTFKSAFYNLKSLFVVRNPWILFDGSLFQLGVSEHQLRIVSVSLLVLLVISCLKEKGLSIRDELDKQNIVFRGLIYLLFIVAIILYGVYGSGYNASAFLYQNI